MNLSVTDIYIFGLCFVVFTALTVLLAVLIVTMLRYYVRLVRLGAEDEKIRQEYDNRHKHSKFLNALGNIINILVFVVLLTAFGCSVAVKICERNNCNAIDTGALRVVRSNSMSKAYEKNEYLFENGLEGDAEHFSLFDIIYTESMPPEKELKLYDVVVYQMDEYWIIHRIVKIEEPNEKHPDETYYYFRGDYNNMTDPKPVTYSQMRGIWHGQKVEQVGSFVLFMRSPAGILCIILMMFAVFVVPFVIKKIENERKERYRMLTGVDLFEEEKLARKKVRYTHPDMTTYYNRPGSLYSNPGHSPYAGGMHYTQPRDHHVNINVKKQQSNTTLKK